MKTKMMHLREYRLLCERVLGENSNIYIVCPLVSYLTFLRLHFFINKMGIKTSNLIGLFELLLT